jgi:hypothetical protein
VDSDLTETILRNKSKQFSWKNCSYKLPLASASGQVEKEKGFSRISVKIIFLIALAQLG